MIEGLRASWVSQTEALKEILLLDSTAPDEDSAMSLTVIVVVGPPDPNALSYLVPRAVFERGLPVHVGALGSDEDLVAGMLEILEVMNQHDIVVFLCQDQATLDAVIDHLQPELSDPHGL